MPHPNDASNPDAIRAAEPSADASGPFPTASTVRAAGGASLDNDHDEAARAGDAFVKLLVDGAHAAIDKLADSAGPAVDRLAGMLGGRSGSLSALAEQAADRREEWVGDVREMIRENPIAAFAAAIAVGAVCIKLASPARRVPRDLDE